MFWVLGGGVRAGGWGVTIRILQGDCRDVLRTLESGSIQCCVTSPPYYGLRDYGIPDQIGLESSPDIYVAELVTVFREVRRVLRDDGVLFLNLGDSYAGGKTGRADEGPDDLARRAAAYGTGIAKASANTTPVRQRPVPDGLKPKDLIGIPWMTAFALRADGWWLRSDIIWAKKNCMPESVKDRPSSAHEHVFLLTKSAQYFYDAEAIREDGVIPAGTRAAKGSNIRSGLKDVNGRPPEYWNYTGTRNSRNVWSVATQPYADAHFATFPPELAERCIRAGTSERGCCTTCGTPWVRVVKKSVALESGSGKSGRQPHGKGAGAGQIESGDYDIRMGPVVSTVTTGWQPSCSCHTAIVPCTVLDPFAGAFTTCMVADRLQLDSVGIEHNPEYAAMAKRRLTKDAGMFASVTTE